MAGKRTRGVVAAGHELTARAGCEMLEAGGNAFDAAVAACFASFVCESALTSPGGGGFFMAHTEEGSTVLYDFFTDVPGKGEDMRFFPVDISFTGTFQKLFIGEGSVAVPGTMAGLKEVHQRHCTLPLDLLLSPAVRHAREGVRLNHHQARIIEVLSPMLTISEEGRKVYAPGGRLLREGDTIFNRDLAATLELLSREGLDAFYAGDFAESMVRTFGPPRGLITREDLASYAVERRRPLVFAYRGREIHTNPPPSSGGSLVAFSLKLIEAYDIKGLGHNTAAGLRLLYEVMRVTNLARREGFDGKVRDTKEAEGFLSEVNVSRYRERIGGPFEMVEEKWRGNTTHISVVDERGNAASVTTSLGIGCGYMLPGTGVMMNNMLGEEDLNPMGFHAQKAGTRLSSMMSPTIVMNQGRPEIVLGTGGSKRIRSAILQVILNLLDHGLDVCDAVNSPRVHWDGEVLQVEEGIGAEELGPLRDAGIEVNRWNEKHMYFGGANVVFRDRGAGDVRRGGVSLTVE